MVFCVCMPRQRFLCSLPEGVAAVQRLCVNVVAPCSKKAKPVFKIFWAEEQPTTVFGGADEPKTTVTVVGGRLAGMTSVAPPPDSWAADPANDVVVATLRLQRGARWVLPAATPGINRTLYFFVADPVASRGASLTVDGTRLTRAPSSVTLRSDVDVELFADGACDVEALLLQGRPIGAPVRQRGPFVAASDSELAQAFDTYRRTEFGGWPHATVDPVHPRDRTRFARMPDGTLTEPPARGSGSGTCEA